MSFKLKKITDFLPTSTYLEFCTYEETTSYNMELLQNLLLLLINTEHTRNSQHFLRFTLKRYKYCLLEYYFHFSKYSLKLTY